MSVGGEFRHKVWADEPVALQDPDSGEELIEFVPRGRMSCKILPITGREFLRSDQILADMDTRVIVRWSTFAAQITAKWRLRFERNGSQPMTFNIARPPAERGLQMREIEFFCNTGKNDG
jgi:head-tail adaptor